MNYRATTPRTTLKRAHGRARPSQAWPGRLAPSSVSERAQVIRAHPGQSLALVAVLLPFLGALLMTSIEIGERFLERAMLEDALQQATRSAVQSFDYAGFAANTHRLAGEPQPTRVGCADAPPRSARAVGCAVARRNLAGVRGLAETPEELVARITWTIHPAGGSCTFPNQPPVSSPTPLVCATVRPKMLGLLGWGVWTPQIDAAETLDTVAP